LFQKQDYNAKLSDFGLAKDGPVGDKSHVSTRVMGTYGYAAPEYIMTGKVYSELRILCSCTKLGHSFLSVVRHLYWTLTHV